MNLKKIINISWKCPECGVIGQNIKCISCGQIFNETHDISCIVRYKDDVDYDGDGDDDDFCSYNIIHICNKDKCKIKYVNMLISKANL